MQNLIIAKCLKFFLENPYQEVYLRELSKKLSLSTFSVKKYMDLLIKENLIKEDRKANLRYFKANASNIWFKYVKIAFNIRSILKSKLIDLLKEEISNISSIVLFGSAAKGEDNRNSDIDLLIIGNKKQLDLSKYREELGKDINIHILSWSEWNNKAKEDKPFYFEVISHGIAIYGGLPLIWK